MFSWRITKYNPVYRDKNDIYTNCEWTSISDIGRLFAGKELSFSDYITVENSYIEAVLTFMNSLAITSLTVKNLEKNYNSLKLHKEPNLYSEEMIVFYNSIQNNAVIAKREIQYLCRLVLREHLWCKLETNNIMFVHFGYDYYMYIGSNKRFEGVINTITNTGLFVEAFESPYDEEGAE